MIKKHVLHEDKTSNQAPMTAVEYYATFLYEGTV